MAIRRGDAGTRRPGLRSLTARVFTEPMYWPLPRDWARSLETTWSAHAVSRRISRAGCSDALRSKGRSAACRSTCRRWVMAVSWRVRVAAGGYCHALDPSRQRRPYRHQPGTYRVSACGSTLRISSRHRVLPHCSCPARNGHPASRYRTPAKRVPAAGRRRSGVGRLVCTVALNVDAESKDDRRGL